MIPPCDPSILEHNPQFKRLYENLTKNLLDADGSTRSQSASPARTAAVEDLKQCQNQNAKKRIKERTLRQLAFALDSGLPAECHDNLAIITLYLETPRSALDLDAPKPDSEDATTNTSQDETLSLLGPDFEAFYSNIPAFILPFTNILSSSLHDARTLAATADSPADQDQGPAQGPGAPASSRPNHNSRARARDRRVRSSMASVPLLSEQLAKRVRALRTIQLSELPEARREMAATAAGVVAVRAKVLERTVVILERAKHGALARATRAKADHLATVAQGIEGKLEVMKLEIAATIYTPETIAALTRYKQHLRQIRERLEDAHEMAIQELKTCGDVEASDSAGDIPVDRDTVAGIARQYGVLVRDVETVQMEIARLEQ
ncbi:uncharacterized protein N7511_005830 [Penicillium nucicola]|uniref:uncharacterized protein n=1 Tax=Penicillium nucicola TaxID=1850975 RepID=UPI00254505AF|nr:uncharacterized protein N7511_005830 [Penicillium nucicola]KAJ5762448.1 hypothetical protein N7511_005830 [Penicillium nucicola]